MTRYEQPHGLEFATEAAQMFDACADILRGHHPYVQGAVLADLLAMLLAGFRFNNPEATKREREKILADHIEQVRLLIKENDKIIDDRRANPNRHHH